MQLNIVKPVSHGKPRPATGGGHNRCPRCKSLSLVMEHGGVACLLCSYDSTSLMMCQRCGGQVLRFSNGVCCVQCSWEPQISDKAYGDGRKGNRGPKRR